MKKNYKNFKAMVAALLLSASSIAQPISESFDNVPALFTSGWAQQNLSSSIGTSPDWFQGDALVFPAQASTGYISVNYNSVAGAGDISNWLFTPTRTLQNGDVITFWSRTTASGIGSYPDNLQVRMSTNGASVNAGTTTTSVGDFTTLLLEINPTLSNTVYPTVWTQYSITISGLSGPTSGRIAFRYFVTNGGPLGLNSDYIGVDEYVYTPAGGGSANVTLTQTQEYTLIPLSQLTAFNLQARLSNVGTASTNDATLQVNVYQAPNLTTPVFTQTSSNTTLAAGANQLVSVGTYTPPGLGTYYFQYISNCTGNTINSSDTSVYDFTVTTSEYARDNGTSAQGIGGGNTISCIIGNNFQINSQTRMDSVLFFVYTGAAGLGDTVRVRIANTNAGVPSNTSYIGFSANYVLTAADTGGAVLILPVTNLTNGPLVLNPGNYFVGIEESLTGDNYGLQCAASIFTSNTVYANINNGTYSPLNTLLAGFNYTPIIRPIFQKCFVSATQSITACGSYTWINGTTYTSSNNTATFTVTNAAGCDSLITLNLTINPIDNATATYASNTICTGSPNSVPTVTTSGGIFSSNPAGLVFVSSSTGEIDVASSSANTYTVTYTTSGTCSNTSTQTITITSSPVADFTYANTSYCINDNNPTPVLQGSAGSFTSSPAGLSITTGTGVIDLANSNSGTYTVVNTILASGACPTVIDSVTVIVNPVPTAAVSGGGNICAGDSISVTVALTGSGPWNFTLSDGTNPTTVNSFSTTSYSLTVQSSGNYSIINVSDANCSNTGTGSAAVVVNSLPIINFSLANDTVCLNSGSVVLNASPAGGTFSGIGVSGTTFDPSASGAGTYSIVYSYTDANLCSNSDSQSLVVDLCTGINELNVVENVFIAPNPASDNITIAFQNQSINNITISIVSIDGKLVFSDVANLSSAYSKQINVSTFAKGLYFIHFVSEKGMKTHKIAID